MLALCRRLHSQSELVNTPVAADPKATSIAPVKVAALMIALGLKLWA
uniref:Uncharacterized protein n=1 Tax=Anguilla anguilla TaxID=7936 RepID=A0A0E9V3C9_ANGAN